MSIEQENFEDENVETSLEQYGVWVKKSPSEASLEDTSQMDEIDDNGEILDLGEGDFDSSSLEIFSEDESVFDDDFGMDLVDSADDSAVTVESDDSDDTTLTTDELLNITSDMDVEESADIDDSFDMDFDTFMDDTESITAEEPEDSPVDSDEITFDATSDFEFMDEDVTSSETAFEQSDDDSVVAVDHSDDFDISFDDFTDDFSSSEGSVGETVAEETASIGEDLDIPVEETALNNDIEESSIDLDGSDDISFESLDDFSFDTVSTETDSIDIDDTISEDASSIDFGEEITLDDIPSVSDSEKRDISFEEEKEPVQDFNISIEPETAEESVASTESVAASNDTTDVLSQIVAELSNLRSEMSQFKTELAKIKTDKVSASPKADGTAEGGFFTDYEGDDTIALSGDELNNILTSADFTVDDEGSDESESIEDTETVSESSIVEGSSEEESFDISEESVSEDDSFDIGFDDAIMSEDSFDITEESMIEDESLETSTDDAITFDDTDFDSSETAEIELDTESFEIDDLEENYFNNDDTTLIIEDKELVEPSLDDINFDMDGDDGLPDEIEVPVIEDLVVDSSPVNFFDDEEEEPKEIDDSAMQYLQDDPIEESEEIDMGGVEEEEVIDSTVAEDDDFDIEFDETSVIDETDDDVEIEEDLSSEIADSEIDAAYTEPDSNAPVSSIFKSDQWQSTVVETDEDDFTGEKPQSFATDMQEEIKSVLSYMDRLLESLPEEKISEFAQSEYFGRYKKLFSDLGIS